MDMIICAVIPIHPKGNLFQHNNAHVYKMRSLQRCGLSQLVWINTSPRCAHLLLAISWMWDKRLKISCIDTDCFTWCVNNLFWFMINTYRSVLELPIKFNPAIVCGVSWTGEDQGVSNQDFWMLRSNMYIVQNIAYAEHSVGQQMNVYCNTLSITNTDIGTITDVIDHLIF